MQLILASNSPRRRQLLKEKGIKFNVIVGDFKEESFSSNPVETATTFARGKAKDVFSSLVNTAGFVVLGADTVVYHDGKILGKPKTKSDARNMLKSLSGKTHTVITGYSFIYDNKEIIGYSQSKVKFKHLTDKIINDYIQSGLYKGKAGSYGIQDDFPLVESYNGSYENIIGLPIDNVVKILKQIEMECK